MAVNLTIPSLGDKFQDYRKDIPGDSYSWGPVINANNINAFTYHHSVTKQTAKNDGNWKAECDVLAKLHLNRGWAGIGYRFVICSDGTVAYVGDLGRGGSAVADHNDHMFSACFVGDFTKELPTAAQVHSAHLLAKHFLTQMPQYPNLARWDQIYGHQDWNPTACPGSNWRTESGLRDRILNDHYQGYPNPQPTVTQPVPEPQPEPPTDQDCEKRIAGYKSRITDLTNQLGNATAELENREEQVSRLKQQVLDEQNLRKDLNNKLNDAIKKASEIQGVYEGQLKDKQSQIDTLAKEKGELNQTVKTLELEIQNLKTKISELQKDAVGAIGVADLLGLALKKLVGR